MTEAMIHGFLLALGLILPLGVQNVFIMNQGMNHSALKKAMPAVITASLCDTVMIVAAVSGISVVVLKWEWLNGILLGLGSLFLIYMGWTLWTSEAVMQNPASEQKFDWRRQVVFAASVSLLNPHAILDTIGVIGTTSIGYIGVEKTAFTSAVIVVSWIWFTGLAIAGHRMGNVNWAKGFRMGLSKCSALLIWSTAVYMVWKLIGSA
ncbi:amino acid transporter [Paenibacillus sp. H1-7]|uniref:LysE/ArgO family amino acid transporter n=1 Tax=Paenibacillus sp. H1-7 TaxID=2282849 RepID=UPI001EF9096B|nr:LysE family transporter [Paenibacillus sp. H1-7]ULL16249.1 amino acid transporter [Paenibacillus sp. H1-7]